MSTRCNIRIKPHTGEGLWLYRHCDGYLSCTGADILEKVATIKRQVGAGWPASTATVANAFLKDLYEKQSYEKEPKHVYQLTDDQHGDVEYVYTITISGAGGLGVVYRKGYGEKWSADIILSTAAVNAEIMESNQRAEKYLKEQGRPFEPQALLPV